MNRRNFFKAVTGFVAGVFAACVPKVVGAKRSGTRPATEKDFQDALTQVVKERLEEIPLLAKERDYECHTYSYLNEDGTGNVGLISPSSTEDVSAYMKFTFETSESNNYVCKVYGVDVKGNITEIDRRILTKLD